MGNARGRPRALQCYVGERAFNARQLVRLIGDDNILKRHMAISKRDDLGRQGLALNDEKRNIYVSPNVRSCEHHLDEDGLYIPILLPGLQFINRPLRIDGQEIATFLEHLRVRANKPVGLHIAKLSDEEFKCIAPITKDQFEELHVYCDSVIHNGKRRYTSKKNLLTFLCKMRQGLSDEFLKDIFDYSSRQNVSSVIDYVRLALTERFVPMSIGTASITRADYIAQHVTPFSNALYNPQPDEPKAIAIIDIDRGYRDAVPFLEHLGIDHRMPAIVQRGERQLATEDANATRIITKTRWIVESRNGHLRLVFKFLDKPFSVQHANHIGDFYRIAGAILNRFYPVILIQNATIELAQEMRNVQWRRLHHWDIPAFPVLDLEYLRDLTLGVYQVNLAPSYIQDKLIRENVDEIQVDIHMNEEGFESKNIFEIPQR
ncbi:hypothetical protein CBL_20765 [Carabus blaptoides fortunei]